MFRATEDLYEMTAEVESKIADAGAVSKNTVDIGICLCLSRRVASVLQVSNWIASKVDSD